MNSLLAKQLLLASALVPLVCLVSEAQFLEKDNNPLLQKTQNQTQSSQLLQNLKIGVMDGAVDPKEYIVGPSDIYSVNVWTSPPLNLQLPVTPEGSIIIPTVGEVSIAGLRLDEAKKKVLEEMRKKYISADLSFTLFIPRYFTVKVVGAGFLGEMSVYVQATARAENAVSIAKDQLNESLRLTSQTSEERKKLEIKGSLRKIILHHRDGTQSVADIEKFDVTHDGKDNSLLRDGDVVIVPEKDVTRDFVSFYGGVNGEGVYEYVEGDSLLAMIHIAHDFSPLADSSRVEVFRQDSLGNEMRTMSVDVRSIAAGRSPDFPLHRGDQIVVREKSALRRDYKVQVEGEVVFPGFYPTTKDSTKLSEIINAAGGFTDFASLTISKIFRRSITQQEISSERLESARGGVTPEDSAYFYLETNVRLNRELVVVDFVSLFLGHDVSKDVYLKDGDEIVIASQQKTIYVFGQVVTPGHVLYQKGQSYDFYVNLAGGFTEYARPSDVRIIKANTKQWLKPGETTIEGGDYVWVPKEPYRPFGYYMQVYGALFSIIGTMVTVVVLVVQLKK